ncbi:MAG TPA: hypothetical protein DCE56_35870 [Cyanobacteria bacterium UBA8553]|nr:hypothetical protein [Cyanobacteria bacterium UBA8553]
MQVCRSDKLIRLNNQLVLKVIPARIQPKSEAATLSEKSIVVAFGLLVSAIAIAQFVAIQALVSWFWGKITVFQLVSGVSVVVAIALAATILFYLIKLVQLPKRLFQAFWDSLDVD